MAVDAKQIRQWSDELARLALLPGSDALAEALDLCLAVETEVPRTAPLAAPENSVKMAEICLRYLTVRPAPLPADAGDAIRRIVSGKTGRMWSLALAAEYGREMEELLNRQRDASEEAQKLQAEAAALRRTHDRMKQYADLLDALAGKRPAPDAVTGENKERTSS